MATEPAGFEDIRRESYQRLVQAGLDSYSRVIIPITFAMYLILASLDRVAWRRWSLGAVVVVLTALTLATRRNLSRSGTSAPLSSATAVAVSLAVNIFVAALTGGILSPFAIPWTYAVLVWAFAATRTVSTSAVLVAAASVWVGMLVALRSDVLMPSAFLDDHGRLSRLFYVYEAIIFSIGLYLGRDGGTNLRRMGDDMLRRSLQMRDEMLQLHAERARELTTLSGEIAHELKNPLASLKGLTSLVELDPARAGERIGVMKGEIERMQSILHDFLNFARPLGPLRLEEHDLRDLCGEVVYLHEGLAHGRGIALSVEPGVSLSLPCDARKIKQLLVNLVQNALEASADGSPITLAAGVEGEFGCVQVRDRGAGLPAELAVSGPLAGATTKAHGSGIGLTIVRALAEQHGGRFRLFNRDGGGCVAELALPLRAAA